MEPDVMVKVDFGEDLSAQAVLIHWVYDAGALVRQGEMIAEAMVDKVTLSIEAPKDGYLTPLIQDNDTFHPGQDIARITARAPQASSAPAEGSKKTSAALDGDEFVPAPPRVRRYAQEKGVNLKELAQVITHRPLTVGDVDEWLAGGASEALTAYSPFRRQLIENLTDVQSLPTTLHRRVYRGDGSWPLLACIAWAVDQALLRHPALHGWATDAGFTPARSLRLGIATHTPGGLMVPIVEGSRDRDAWTQALEKLRQAAQEARWEGWDLSRPSFILSNLGPWGIEYFTPRLMAPTVAILGLGAADAQSVPVSVTFDHRAVDGVEAASFLATVDELLRS